MSWKFSDDPRVRQGLTNEQYMTVMRQQAEADPKSLDAEAADRIEYTRLNLHRSERIERTYQPAAPLIGLMAAIVEPQLWLVITEPWCGDSAQCMPYFASLAKGNEFVDMRYVLRDENLDIMDEFLTNGSRSIPKLVALDEQGEILWQWGPRPAGAQAVFDQCKAEGMEKPELLERLHLFYGRDRGKSLEQELITLLTPR
jgi:hypothetical protein